ncbi:patatin-like phospholipase family protein [Marinagarivorans algicola]|uniref:patatin-like phospholipase family protein n=1 Tax=Marinagarivorans algicola TaxID=1513270 RepID=UPI0006B483A0|nr:patatin-like phospholipase family protein [Marinagarivorans algicola]
MSKTVSLVLGSGGARGLAHIGVIRILEARGYDIRSISGCSMGAMVGGIYAAGKLDEFEQWIRALTRMDVLRLLDMSWGRDGLVKGDKIINKLIDIVGDQRIEDLPITFTAVAADVSQEKEVWLNSGSLFEAIRASISLPLFFTPVPYKNSYLIDGGVLNPVPIAPAFSDTTDLIIAVNLGGPLDAGPNTAVDNNEKIEASDSLPSILRTSIDQFLAKLPVFDQQVITQKWSAYDIANQAFDAMQSSIARQKLAVYPPDILIEIARNACGTLEFDRAAHIIALGKTQCEEALQRYLP